MQLFLLKRGSSYIISKMNKNLPRRNKSRGGSKEAKDRAVSCRSKEKLLAGSNRCA